ncbi:MAG: CDP-alcohol phosphatidyltransferase family protein, partial [Clostridia bacterium]|nr:CDP-alcohol phosphatidyltransferase family protein [Clostridia bacterium]
MEKQKNNSCKEKIRKAAANIITVSRIPFSVLLLVFSPFSVTFTVLYLLCGITDVLDGFIARKLHTQSEKGARLDSIADLIFAIIYAVRILPLLSVPYWIWIWTAVIAVIKIAGIVIASRKAKKLT